MYSETFPVFKEKNVFNPDLYVLIEYIPIPSMCPEFDPGPSEDDPFPEFYETAVTVFLIDPNAHTVSEIGHKAMKQMYRYIGGRRERISYWRVMKYFEYCHKEKNND